MSSPILSWLINWRHLTVKPISVEDAELVVEQGSAPTFAFYFMLALSTVIATLGLLANSAAVIIGAMIVAPLMSPIISFSYGIVAGSGALTMRSFFTAVTGTLLTIVISYLFADVIGWKLVGSEIVARMRPTLLDLGIAVAAGAAAAFAYTRSNISSSLAGIAIAVALVPPLCTVGIIMALGNDASVEVGLAIDNLSALNPFLLYLTNFIGIILASSMVFYWQYYRRRLLAILALVLVFSSLMIVIPPLGITLDNLLVRNQIHRSLTVESRELIPAEHNVRFTNLNVRIEQNAIYVRGDIVATSGAFNQELINALRNKISKMFNMPLYLELGIIPERILRSNE